MCKSNPMSINHAVLAVGYGVSDVEKDDRGNFLEYYIVKNSWSES